MWRIKNKVNYKALEEWYRDRIIVGAMEESGSCDSYMDELGFTWHITKRDDGKYEMTTEMNPIPFAIGMITKTGKTRINWKR